MDTLLLITQLGTQWCTQKELICYFGFLRFNKITKQKKLGDVVSIFTADFFILFSFVETIKVNKYC